MESFTTFSRILQTVCKYYMWKRFLYPACSCSERETETRATVSANETLRPKVQTDAASREPVRLSQLPEVDSVTSIIVVDFVHLLKVHAGSTTSFVLVQR